MLLTIVHDNNGKIYKHKYDDFGAILLEGDYNIDELFVSLIDSAFIDCDNWRILDLPVFIDPREKYLEFMNG
jgi:hypothetical protein